MSWPAEQPFGCQERLMRAVSWSFSQSVSQLFVRSPVECRSTMTQTRQPVRVTFSPPANGGKAATTVGAVSSEFPIFSRCNEVKGASCSPPDAEIPINQSVWLQRHLKKLHRNLPQFPTHNTERCRSVVLFALPFESYSLSYLLLTPISTTSSSPPAPRSLISLLISKIVETTDYLPVPVQSSASTLQHSHSVCH
jgi:hypothetical protein